MKISKVLFALIGCQTSSYALPLSDELKALSNFDFWADSVTSRVPYGKEPVSFFDIAWTLLDNWRPCRISLICQIDVTYY